MKENLFPIQEFPKKMSSFFGESVKKFNGSVQTNY